MIREKFNIEPSQISWERELDTYKHKGKLTLCPNNETIMRYENEFFRAKLNEYEQIIIKLTNEIKVKNDQIHIITCFRKSN